MHHTDKYSEHSSIIWPVWLNGQVFIYELSGCGFKSSCSHLNFRPYQMNFSWVWSSRISLTSWGEGASLALVDHPSSDGIMIKIPYGLGVLSHPPALHPVFSYWVG